MISLSDSPTQDFIDVDAAQLVKDAAGSTDYRLMFRQEVETYYRKLIFASSDHPVDSLHPKLIWALKTSTDIAFLSNNDLISVYPNPTTKLAYQRSDVCSKIQLKLFSMNDKLLKDE